MKKYLLNSDDHDLIKYAIQSFGIELSREWHGVASAVRLRSGRMERGFVLESENPALTVCSEPIVIGKVLEDIDRDPVITIVAVRNRDKTDDKVIPPCGRCREFMTDYAPDANVIVYDKQEQGLRKVSTIDLLPFKYEAS